MLDLLVFGSVLIPPSTFWPAIFLGYLIPPIMVLTILIGVYLIIRYRKLKHVVFGLALILVTTPFWGITYKFSTSNDTNQDAISLLSYNVKLFREPSVYTQFSMDMIEMVVNDSSSIKCLQEFSTNSRWAVLDVTKQIEKTGYYSHIHKATHEKYGDHDPGMAIFSKYPILNRGTVLDKDGVNTVIYADISIDNDTLRVYNVHLTSYRMDFTKKSFLQKIPAVLYQVKSAVNEHTNEIDQLLGHLKECEYPFIISGDFNESPYSYNYFQLSELQNAFENKGNGFGFTMIKPPLFLRIDNTFYSREVNLEYFTVDYSMDISDHYPTRSFFSLK